VQLGAEIIAQATFGGEDFGGRISGVLSACAETAR
jgi:hypothetical protein